MLQKCSDDVQDRLIINASKSSSMLIQPKRNTNDTINVVNDEVLHQSSAATYLGVGILEHLQWNNHIDKLCSRLSFKISMLTHLRSHTPPYVLRWIYFACIQHIDDHMLIEFGAVRPRLCYI